MIRFIAYSPDGVPRVWGEGKTAEIAETRCREALLEYVKRRRDFSLAQYVIEDSRGLTDGR